MRQIEGFDYTTHQTVMATAHEWQERLRAALKAGGRRRVEAGETFIHAKGGRIIAEIYANVPAPREEA